jgi:hypothetical protein
MLKNHLGPEHLSYNFSKIIAVSQENGEYKSFDQITNSFWFANSGLSEMFFEICDSRGATA